MHASDHSILTLAELLKWRSIHSPNEIAFIVDEKSYNYGWLWDKAQSYATKLMGENVEEKDRVLLLAPNGAAFFVAFYGAILSGAIAVPVFPNAGTERCQQIMQLCGARNIILPADIHKERKEIFNQWAMENDLNIHWVDEAMESIATKTLPSLKGDEIAFIQYTSGSTSFPKGVPLTHFNLLSNVRQMVKTMKITSEDVFVSWLPVYHDMGLILNTMAPFYTGGVLVLLAEGLHKVHSWLKAIEKYKGTFISAPDIAYRLCVKSIRRPEDYELSSLRVALNASERIQRQTYQLFEETFELKNVMVSGYGLAEATVGVTMHPPGEPPVVDANAYVASGRALPGVEIKIDSGESDTGIPGAGEILVRSSGLMQGYFNQKESPSPIDSNGYLRTGDIGYLDLVGNLFVLARKKNCIKHAGHTLYPDDVEQVVKSVEGIRQVAALGIDKLMGSGEILYVFAEFRASRKNTTDQFHDMAVDVAGKINAHFGIKPGKVFLVKPKTLPRTPNGKMQHASLKNMYLKNLPQLKENTLYP